MRKPHPSKGRTKYLPGICEQCLAPFQRNWRNHDHRFCSKSCARLWLWEHKREQMMSRKNSINSEEHRKQSSERMKFNNPSKDQSVIARIAEKLKGRGPLQRGGNGYLTKQQQALCDGWEMEYCIPTGNPSWKRAQVDIAYPDKKIAVEVHGNSHRSLKQKNRDKIKAQMLRELGWTLVVVWNSQVEKHLSETVEFIQLNIYRTRQP